MAEIAAWYVLGCLGSAAIGLASSRFADDDFPRLAWIDALLGPLESAIVITLVGGSVSGAMGFAGLWIVIRAIGEWPLRAESARRIRVAGVVASVLLAAILGLLVRRALAGPGREIAEGARFHQRPA